MAGRYRAKQHTWAQKTTTWDESGNQAQHQSAIPQQPQHEIRFRRRQVHAKGYNLPLLQFVDFIHVVKLLWMLSQVNLRATFLPTRGGDGNNVNVNVNVNAVSSCNSNSVQQRRGL